MLLIAWIIRRRNAMPKLKKLGLVLAIAWIACLILIALGEFISSSKILMLSTSMLVILTFFSSPLTATNIIYKVIKPETKFRK
jgi:hypothetical protein